MAYKMNKLPWPMKITSIKLWKHRSNVLICKNIPSNSNIFIQNKQYPVKMINKTIENRRETPFQ